MSTTYNPAISVVIPLYNKENTILRAIQSVINQSMDDFEIIIIDDGSTDSSRDKVLTISDERIKLFTQENMGPGAARNRGVQRATAEIIAFLDADDEWRETYLESGIKALRENPRSIAYVTGYNSGAFSKSRPNRVKQRTKFAREISPIDQKRTTRQLRGDLHALHSSATMIRRENFNTIGGFYEKNRCLWGEDSYLWAQVLFMGPIFWDPADRVLFHVEDSDLGFAVSGRSEARPLTYLAQEISNRIPRDQASAFLSLSKSIAAHDAKNLVKSGYNEKAKEIRKKHGISLISSFIGDKLRFVKRKLKESR